jgi:hypothetical protein
MDRQEYARHRSVDLIDLSHQLRLESENIRADAARVRAQASELLEERARMLTPLGSHSAPPPTQDLCC